MTSSLLDRLRAHLARRRLFPAPGTAVLAVSGGADSVALLDLMQALAPALGLELVVAHADHGIQTVSRSVGQAVKALAEKYGLPFELGELGLGPDASETVARRARYAWLREVQQRRGARYLVTAHQADDQVETVLWRALRGSGTAGLSGIAARGARGLVRPLLGFSRATLAAHARERGLPVHDDPANADPRHVRSWIRAGLLPFLVERLGEGVRKDVARLGRHAAADRRAWSHVLDLLPDLDLRVDRDGFDVARGRLARYDAALARAVLGAAARRAGIGVVLGPVRASRALKLARGASGRRVELGGGWIAEAAFDRLRVARAEMVGDVEVVEVGDKAQGTAVFGAFRVSWRPEMAPGRPARTAWTTWIGADQWQLRTPRSGDRMVPLGGVGHRPLRRLLMEARVPRGARGQYPVIARGDAVLWVPGVCRAASDVPSPGTRAVRLDVTEYREPETDRRA